MATVNSYEEQFGPYISRDRRKKKEDEKPETQNTEKSPADMLPNFREAFPTSDDLNDDGCAALARGIILRAAYDYYQVAMNPIKMTKEEFKNGKWNQKTNWEWVLSKDGLHYFVHTEFFNDLTDIHPDHFEKTLIQRRASGKKIPNITETRM